MGSLTERIHAKADQLKELTKDRSEKAASGQTLNVLEDCGDRQHPQRPTAGPHHGQDDPRSPWDNQPTWDNWPNGPGNPFDNRPIWDNWSKWSNWDKWSKQQGFDPWNNSPTWDNWPNGPGSPFDNRPTWDNWNKQGGQAHPQTWWGNWQKWAKGPGPGPDPYSAQPDLGSGCFDCVAGDEARGHVIYESNSEMSVSVEVFPCPGGSVDVVGGKPAPKVGDNPEHPKQADRIHVDSHRTVTVTGVTVGITCKGGSGGCCSYRIVMIATPSHTP